jgi:cupin 2 domain-containing protein
MKIGNIFELENYIYDPANEFFHSILEYNNIRIEKIISQGHCSPPGFWYDQDEYEWVILLQGKAKLMFFDKEESIELNQGDYLLIAPHEKHRLEWTPKDEKTIWLAIFFR